MNESKQLTQEQVKELFHYHPYGNLIRKVKMAVRAPAGSMPTTIDSQGYLVTNVMGKKYKVHRLIFLWHHGYMPEEVDHRNGDKSDCRIENLRAATKGQNQHNKGLQKNNSTGVKGVSWHKVQKKWKVSVMLDKKKQSLGTYNNLMDAACAAISGRNRLHGEFARHS